jgi:hypothetical protein
MTSLLRRLASNGLFRLPINRHGEGKFPSYEKDEKILASRETVTSFTRRHACEKYRGPSQQDGPTLTPRCN